MGRDKLLLEVGGVPLLRRVADTLSARCAEVIVVGEGGESARLDNVRHISGERPGNLGPLAGMEAGLAAAKSRLAFVAAGDMPFVSADLVCYLLERLERRGASAVVPLHRGTIHPLCAAYDREILPRIGAALDRGTRSVRELLEGVGSVEYVESELGRIGDPDLFLMNVNSPGDLQRARAPREGSP
jgi:molybdopterin-guanine dinucleotide biosynthesis protein A